MQANARADAPSPSYAGSIDGDATTHVEFVRLTADGSALVCRPAGTDATESGTVVLGIDARLRDAVRSSAAARTAPATTPADWENDMTPQLRPREIQARIRAGASLEQVAAAAGCPVDRIEGFAFPVLAERAAIAERARASLPLRGAPIGTPGAERADSTLEEIVLATLADRGQQQDPAWDAFKDERGWTVTLTWTVGRTENRAEWAFTAQPSGGTVTPRNAHAADLVEPSREPLRSVDDRPALAEDAAPTSAQQTLFERSTPEQQSGPDDGHAQVPTARPVRRGHKPPMPSWEDVLLGTRTTGTDRDIPEH